MLRRSVYPRTKKNLEASSKLSYNDAEASSKAEDAMQVLKKGMGIINLRKKRILRAYLHAVMISF